MAETAGAGAGRGGGAPLGRALTQVAFVVPDIGAAVAAWAELLGMDPPEVREPPLREGREYRGRPLPAGVNLRVAMFELGPVTLELIEPVGGPSAWSDVLGERGGPAFHHLAFEVADGDAAARALSERGYAPLQSQARANGGRMVYADARGELGAILELLGGPPAAGG